MKSMFAIFFTLLLGGVQRTPTIYFRPVEDRASMGRHGRDTELANAGEGYIEFKMRDLHHGQYQYV